VITDMAEIKGPIIENNNCKTNVKDGYAFNIIWSWISSPWGSTAFIYRVNWSKESNFPFKILCSGKNSKPKGRFSIE
jgi:hypothetical protein